MSAGSIFQMLWKMPTELAKLVLLDAHVYDNTQLQERVLDFPDDPEQCATSAIRRPDTFKRERCCRTCQR